MITTSTTAVVAAEVLESRALFDGTPATAIDFGTLDGRESKNGAVSAIDVNDFYKFRMAAGGRLNMRLSGMSANANLQLIRDADHDGRVDPGESLNTSANAGFADDGSRTYKDFVEGASDANDFYRFTIADSNGTGFNFDATLSHSLVGDAGLQLIRDANNNGVVDRGEVIAASANDGDTDAVSAHLYSGTYFVRVFSTGEGLPTNYGLRLTAIDKPA